MPYTVETNRAAKTARLVYVATRRGHVAPRNEVGQPNRRVIKINGQKYHVTKGWRREVV